VLVVVPVVLAVAADLLEQVVAELVADQVDQVDLHQVGIFH
jgi:hypothetical protein